MIVNVINNQSELSIENEHVQRIVEQVILFEHRRCDEVNIYFVDTSTICQLHADFFNDSTPTDCISFPIDDGDEGEGHCLLGEVFICPATAIAYSKKKDKDPYTETTLYIGHGLLHLMGYDDLETKAKRRMRRAEARHMKNLLAMHCCLK